MPKLYKLFTGDILKDERLKELLKAGKLKAEEKDDIESAVIETPLRYQFIDDNKALGTITHIKCGVKSGAIVLKPTDLGRAYLDKIESNGHKPMAYPRAFTKIGKATTSKKRINLQISRLITFDIGYLKENDDASNTTVKSSV